MNPGRTKLICAVAGLVLAWLIVHYGFYRAVFVVVGGLAGWYVGRILEGEIRPFEMLRRAEGDDHE